MVFVFEVAAVATYDYPLQVVYSPLLPTNNSINMKKVVFPTPLIHSSFCRFTTVLRGWLAIVSRLMPARPVGLQQSGLGVLRHLAECA